MQFTLLSVAALAATVIAATVPASSSDSSLQGPFYVTVDVAPSPDNTQPIDKQQMAFGPSTLNPKTDNPKQLLPSAPDFIYNKPSRAFYFSKSGSLVYKDKSGTYYAVAASDGTMFFGTDAQLGKQITKDTGYKYDSKTGALTHGSQSFYACHYTVSDSAPKDKPDNTRLVRHSGWPYIAVASKKPAPYGTGCYKATMSLTTKRL